MANLKLSICVMSGFIKSLIVKLICIYCFVLSPFQNGGFKMRSRSVRRNLRPRFDVTLQESTLEEHLLSAVL